MEEKDVADWNRRCFNLFSLHFPMNNKRRKRREGSSSWRLIHRLTGHVRLEEKKGHGHARKEADRDGCAHRQRSDKTRPERRNAGDGGGATTGPEVATQRNHIVVILLSPAELSFFFLLKKKETRRLSARWMWRARSVADPIRLFGFPRFSGFTLPGLCDNRRPAHIIPETKSSIKRRPAVLESIKREEKDGLRIQSARCLIHPPKVRQRLQEEEVLCAR